MSKTSNNLKTVILDNGRSPTQTMCAFRPSWYRVTLSKLAYLGEHSYSSKTFLKVIFQHTWTVVWCHRFTQVSRDVATGSQKRYLDNMNTRRSAY